MHANFTRDISKKTKQKPLKASKSVLIEQIGKK